MDIEDVASFDFIAAGEILEHIERPGPFLRKVGGLLSPDGRAFVTTCANCPDVSHVYLFRSVQEIRDLIATCDLSVDRECVAPSVPLSEEEAEKRRLSVSYAALVKRK